MTPDYVAVKPERTVEQALDHIRRYGDDSETLNVIYVVDRQGNLLDDLRIRQVLLAGPEEKIEDLCDGRFVALQATDDQEAAVAVFREYDRVALPVTDSSGVLLGMVTFDDVMDVAEEEATEDIQKIGGMEALDEPYLQAGLGEMLRKRGGWLVLLFLGQMLTVSTMEAYQSKLASAVFLVLFLPLIISSGGNSGTQAATLVIRAMALGEVTLRHWWTVMRREIVSGLALGLCLAAIGFARIAGGQMVTGAYGEHWIVVGITISAALLGVVLWGTILGSMLPFLLKGIGADPATSSTPVVTTIVDVTGLIIYFSLATVVLSGTFL
jgi:magnesium transporter